MGIPTPKALTAGASCAGYFADALNNKLASGYLILTLNVAAAELTGGGEITNAPVKITLDANAQVASGQSMFMNDQVNSPSGTSFKVDVYNSSNLFVTTLGFCVISGSAPVDLTTLTPTSTGASYPAAVIQVPTGQQTINGQDLVIEGAALGFSAAGSTTGDAFVNRSSANNLQIGTTDSNAAGTLTLHSLQFDVNTAPVGSASIAPSCHLYNAAFHRSGGNTAVADVVGDGTHALVVAGKSDGSGAVAFGATSTVQITGGNLQGPGFQKQIFTSSGTFTIPTGITQAKATVTGAGGAGGGGTAATVGGHGGGSGGTSIKFLTGLTPANTITVTVGTGGTGVSAGSGNNGGSSSISSGTQTIGTVTANGGGGGGLATTAPGPGGAAGSGGDFNFGGNTGSPNAQTASNVSGGGAGSIFGGGGATAFGNNTGGAGSAPGAGGGGGGGASANTAGGAGANGQVIFEWVS